MCTKCDALIVTGGLLFLKLFITKLSQTFVYIGGVYVYFCVPAMLLV